MILNKLAVEYAALVKKENAIKAKKKDLALKVKTEMQKMSAKQFGVKQGLFTIHSIPSWKFSKKVYSMIDEVDLLKSKEIESGIAKATYTESVWFTSNKK